MNANALWFTARGAGLAAMLVLTVATTLGALGSIRIESTSTRVITQYVHRTAAVLGLGLIFVHVSTLILDPKAHIGVVGALVPFAAPRGDDASRPRAAPSAATSRKVYMAIEPRATAFGRYWAANGTRAPTTPM